MRRRALYGCAATLSPATLSTSNTMYINRGVKPALQQALTDHRKVRVAILVHRDQHPRRVRLAGAGDVFQAAAADVQADDQVQAAQPDRVDREEITGEDRVCVRLQESPPGQPVALRGRRPAGLGQGVADRGRRDGDAELAQLASDPHIAPARVLAREPQDELAHLMADRRAPWAAVRVRPPASHKPAMPEQVSGLTRNACPLRRGSARPSAVSSSRSCNSNRGWPTCRRRIDQLVPEHENLQLLRPLTTPNEHDQLKHVDR